jgi:hypothetical protein
LGKCRKERKYKLSWEEKEKKTFAGLNDDM